MVAEAEHLLMAQTLSYVMRQDISSLASLIHLAGHEGLAGVV